MKDLSKLWGCRMNEILITGASGFVGRYLLNEIAQSHEVIACVRKKSNLLPSSVQQIIINNFFDITIPQDVDVIVHLAGVAHNKNNDIDEFKKINVALNKEKHFKVKIIAVQDHFKHHGSIHPYGITDIYYLCQSLGGEFQANSETSQAAWFKEDDLPPLAENKNSTEQVKMCFAAHRDANWQTLFD